MVRKITLEEDEIIVWDIFFAGIMSMNVHPGTTRDPPSKKTIEDCADIALEMIEVRRKVLDQ